MTITQPGNAEGGAITAATYIINDQKLSSAAARTLKWPGNVPASKLTSLIK